MGDDSIVVHVTHEAVGKIGGIGTVLQGFFTCKSYLDEVDRSILVGPLFSTDGPASQRLGENGEVLYSSIDGLAYTKYAPAFRMLEDFYNTGIVYGRKTFVDKDTSVKSSVEVLLVDVRNININLLNEFKRRMYERFGIRSDLYEHIWECEQYVRLAPVAIAALKEIDAAEDSTVIISHEFMGMATVLAGILETCCDFKTVFYAHEVATIRRIVEKHPGHDTMFYNVLRKAQENGLYVDEVFGEQDDYFKHAFVEASKYCDAIFAVGDCISDELKFLAPEFETANINIVYNGIPAYKITTAKKQRSKEKLQGYCDSLLGYRPDFVFTHVTRLVQSKGLWRDLRVLEHLEDEFRTRGKTAVMFLLSTETAQRDISDIINMESTYNWPVAHREGHPDLSGGEAGFYTAIQQFNAASRNIKVIFINQFGFDRKTCGNRMPEDMEFMDIRRGSDVEFGMSVYEPFGIAQLEPLTFGGICVVSSICGCSGFLCEVGGEKSVRNIIIADYTNLDSALRSRDDSKPAKTSIQAHLRIDRSVRDRIESSVSNKVAVQIIRRLEADESGIEDMVQTGYELAKKMSWDAVVKNRLLPGLHNVLNKKIPETSFQINKQY